MGRGKYIRTKETLEKMSLARKGKKTWNFGIPHTEETKLKIGLKSKGRIPNEETRKKMSNSLIGNKNRLGIKHSIIDRLKMSLSCKGKLAKDKNPNWKGGVTKQNSLLRKSFEITLWKKACLERDNFTCQKTGIRGGELNVHHINNFSDFPELRTSIENGVTLCKDAHVEFHKIYGRKNNTKEQLIEFLSNKEYGR